MTRPYRKRGAPLTWEFFEERTCPRGGCREWMRGRDRCGYGVAKYQGKRWKVHRLAYALFVAPISDDQCVLHSCDNPACVALEHLSLGSHTDNMRDMRAKGRHVPAWSYQDYNMIRPRDSGRFTKGAHRAS